MLNTAGAYILVLMMTYGHDAGGIAMHEFPNFKSCKAAITQLEVERRLVGYCIAKEVLEE